MKPDPNLPRGVQAFLFESAARRRRAEETVVRTLEKAGLSEVILPVLDFARPYQGLGMGDSPLYQFVDRQGELLSLRADFTPMAARVLAPRLGQLTLPIELYYRGDVVRDEESGVGRLREFSQAGAECYGDPRIEADERMLTLLIASLALPPGALTMNLGYAGLMEKVLSAAAPSLTAGEGAKLAAMVQAARERRVTEVEAALVRAGARGAVAAEIAAALLSGFDLSSPLFALPVLAEGAAALRRAGETARRALPGLEVVADLAGTPEAPYYTGLTFSAVARGVAAPLAAGGRYDLLLGRFGHPCPAVGFSVGIETLAAAQESVEKGAGSPAPEAAPRRLRIASGKGRLLPKALDALREAGVDFAEPDGRRLLFPDRSGKFELLLLKDDDVPTYVAHGGADLGVVGSDRVAESGEKVFTPVTFPFGACRLALIKRKGSPFEPNGHPVVVGTKYRRMARKFFDDRRIAHEIVPLAGSVELAAALGLTDVVVDLIETGSTMVANGLEEIETIFPSSATLIVGPAALASRRTEIAALVAGLSGKKVPR
jgi:ATP phosphoribosyltransferase regulatory subunit